MADYRSPLRELINFVKRWAISKNDQQHLAQANIDLETLKTAREDDWFNNTLRYYQMKVNNIKNQQLGYGKRKNPWMQHLKKIRDKYPNLCLSDAMKKAKETYKK